MGLDERIADLWKGSFLHACQVVFMEEALRFFERTVSQEQYE
jgi:hypothetical protein